MALYRKYRPATFAEVVGQEHVTEPLSTALDAGRINHAYLFSGPRGCGKTSSARILARSLNCVEGPTSRPCGKCISCVALAPGGPGNLDVIELDAASHGGVDDTRDLRDRASYAPAESRFRVFIIDEAHMVTSAGFNALLKTVEEPPEHLIFVFATTEPDKVLPTIRSRTHHYPFRLLPPSTMRGLLEGICAQESVEVEPAVFPLVIRAGGGSPRDSLSVLDQLIAGAGPEGVTYPRALALLGVTDVALIDEAVDALAANDGAALFTTIDKVMEAGHDPRRFAIDLLDRLRDLILLRAVPDAGPKGLVEAPGDVLDRMQAEADRIGPATLARYAELVHEGLGEMRGATAPRLLLEVTCARMLLPSASDAESAALQRIERIERRLDVMRPSDEQAADPAPVRRRDPVARGEEAGSAADAPGRAPAESSARRRRDLPSEQPSNEPAADAAAHGSRRDTPAEDSPREPGAAPGAGQPLRETDAEMPPAARVDTPTSPAPRAETPTAEPPVEPRETASPVGAPEPAIPGQPDAAAVRAVWSEVLAKVRERSRTVEVMLSGATVSAIAGNAIVLRHDSGPLAKRLVEPRNADVLREALRDVFGVDWEVRCETGGAAAAPAAPPPRRSAPPKPPKPEGPKFSRPSRTRPAPPDRPDPPRRSAPRNDGPPPDDFPPPAEPPPPDDEPPYDAARSGGERISAERSDHVVPPNYEDGPPPPPTADEEEEMLAEAAQPMPPEERRDPDEVALELLQNELGAKPID